MLEKEKDAAAQRFKQDPKCRVLLAKIQVAGAGLNFPESCYVDMLESSWVPGDNAQAVKRVHRFGQERSVTVRFPTLSGSFDEKLSAVISDKTQNILKYYDSL